MQAQIASLDMSSWSEDEGSLTTAEAAQRLGVSVQRVRQRKVELQGATNRYGRLVFPEEVINAEVNASRTKPGPESQAEMLQAMRDDIRSIRSELHDISAKLDKR